MELKDFQVVDLTIYPDADLWVKWVGAAVGWLLIMLGIFLCAFAVALAFWVVSNF